MITTRSPISNEQKRHAIAEVLTSATFARSDQLRNFLNFICTQELAGNGQSINEYLIGVEVLGRPTSYAPSEEATVRNRAHVLRKKLQEFYDQEGAASPIRIELPKGSYCPYFCATPADHSPRPELTATFHASSALPDLIEPQIFTANDVNPPATMARAKMDRRKMWGLALTAVAVAAMLFSWAAWKLVPPKVAQTALEEFWSPVLTSAHPVLICQSSTVVYLLSGKTKEKQFNNQSQLASQELATYEIDPNEQVPGSDLIPLKDAYMSISNAQATMKLFDLFGRFHKPSQFKISSAANFAEMRNAPSVLPGAFNNRWTMSLTNKQRFAFEERGFRHRIIVDKQDSNRVCGSPNTSVIGQTSEDYAIISRVFQSETGEILITAAGIFQYGTRAAGELLANASFWEEFARQAPAGWQKKNLQIVFSVKVIDNTPGPPTLLATHFW